MQSLTAHHNGTMSGSTVVYANFDPGYWRRDLLKYVFKVASQASCFKQFKLEFFYSKPAQQEPWTYQLLSISLCKPSGMFPCEPFPRLCYINSEISKLYMWCRLGPIWQRPLWKKLGSPNSSTTGKTNNTFYVAKNHTSLWRLKMVKGLS